MLTVMFVIAAYLSIVRGVCDSFIAVHIVGEINNQRSSQSRHGDVCSKTDRNWLEIKFNFIEVINYVNKLSYLASVFIRRKYIPVFKINDKILARKV